MNLHQIFLILSFAVLLVLYLPNTFANDENSSEDNTTQNQNNKKALEYSSEIIPGVSEEEAKNFMYDLFEGKITNFISEHWEKKPLFVRHRRREIHNMARWNSRISGVFSLYKFSAAVLANSTAYYDELTEDDLDEANEDGKVPLRYGKDLKLVKRTKGKDGEWWTGMLPNHWTRDSDLVSDETVAAGFAKRFSVIMNRINYRNKDVLHLAQMFERYWGYPTDVNMFFTPQGKMRAGKYQETQGFEAHFDKMCSFVFQIQGSKQWALYNDALHMPLPHQQFKPKSADLGEPSMVVTLKPGDILFFPRGWVHEARTSSQDSIHLTVGVDTHSITYAFLIHHAIDSSAEVKKKKNPIQDQLPGFNGDLTYQYLMHIILQRQTLEDSNLRKGYPHNNILNDELRNALNDFNREDILFSLVDKFAETMIQKPTKDMHKYLNETLEYIQDQEQSSWDPYVFDDFKVWRPTDEQIQELIPKLKESFEFFKEKVSFKKAHRRLRDQIVNTESSLARYHYIEKSIQMHKLDMDQSTAHNEINAFQNKLSIKNLKKKKQQEYKNQQKQKQQQERNNRQNKQRTKNQQKQQPQQQKGSKSKPSNPVHDEL